MLLGYVYFINIIPISYTKSNVHNIKFVSNMLQQMYIGEMHDILQTTYASNLWNKLEVNH